MENTKNLLMTVFDFTEEDLAANEMGNLTPRQRSVLFNIWWQKHRQSIGNAVIMIGTGICGLLIFNLLFDAEGAFLLFFLLTLSLYVTGIVYTLFPIVQWYLLRRDLQQKKILSLCGRVTQMKKARHWSDYYIKIERQRFFVLRNQYFAFNKDVPYYIYYARHTRYILSVKSMDNPNEHYNT